MPSLPTHHIPQTLIGLVLWLWWATGAFAYSTPYPAHEFATVCNLVTTTDGQRNYSYNSEQRLATTSASPTTANPNPAKTNYLYNALGQRVFKTDPIFGTPTADNQKLGWAYIYDETGTLLGEYGMGGAASSGSTEHIYLPTAQGPLPVATIINGQHYAVHTDHLNTPRRLTAANNQAVWQWAYSAFGQETATTANKRFTSAHTVPQTGTTTTQPVAYHQRYPGQSFDVESGLHYNYFRTYDPQTGRYTQPDPIGLDGGWNRYAYVGGNPLNLTDPTGRCPWCFAAAVGGLVGGGFNLIGQLNGDAPINWASVGIATASGAAGGATGAWIGSVTRSLGSAFAVNAAAGSTINMVSGIADDMANCRSWESNVGKNWLIGATFGGAGGLVGQSINNYSRAAQSWMNVQGAFTYTPASQNWGPVIRGVGDATGAAVGSSNTFIAP